MYVLLQRIKRMTYTLSVLKDQEFRDDCIIKSQHFLKTCILPELLGKWYTRSNKVYAVSFDTNIYETCEGNEIASQ